MTNIELLNKQIEQIEELKSESDDSPNFKAWEKKTKHLLEKIFGSASSQVSDFKNVNYYLGVFTLDTPPSEFQKAHISGLEEAKELLKSYVEELREFNIQNAENSESDTNSYLLLIGLFKSFHKIVRQLRVRHDNRSTLDVSDEYDVQDLLHALLHIYFKDIRIEEWAPSHAGKSSRMDFLLKDEEIVIEVKKTRKGLTEKELGEELILDKEKYKTHPNYKLLICFIYDPEGLIGNPAGFIKDLSDNSEDHKVEIIIAPEN